MLILYTNGHLWLIIFYSCNIVFIYNLIFEEELRNYRLIKEFIIVCVYVRNVLNPFIPSITSNLIPLKCLTYKSQNEHFTF